LPIGIYFHEPPPNPFRYARNDPVPTATVSVGIKSKRKQRIFFNRASHDGVRRPNISNIKRIQRVCQAVINPSFW
jgi:hypothetical protein